MEASRRIRKLEEASAQRIRELEEASERCISLEKHFAEERIAQAEAAAEQRAKAAEEAAAAVARRIAEVEDSAAQQRAVAAEESAAQYAMGLEAMVGVAAQRAAHSAAAQVALALRASPSRTSTLAWDPLAHVFGRTGVRGAWDDASTSEVVPADFLPDRGSEVLDRVGLRLRVCVDMADSVEAWLTANARTSRESTRVNLALRSARLHLVASSERLGDDDTFLEALTELLAMRHALLPLLSGEGVEEEADEADCR
jgi:hypothetical protein